MGVVSLVLRLSDQCLALALLCAISCLFVVCSAGVLLIFLTIVVDIDLKRSFCFDIVKTRYSVLRKN